MQNWTDFTSMYQEQDRRLSQLADAANAAYLREFGWPARLRRVLTDRPRFPHGLRSVRRQPGNSATRQGRIAGGAQ
jgi:hypothetical protein